MGLTNKLHYRNEEKARSAKHTTFLFAYFSRFSPKASG